MWTCQLFISFEINVLYVFYHTSNMMTNITYHWQRLTKQPRDVRACVACQSQMLVIDASELWYHVNEKVVNVIRCCQMNFFILHWKERPVTGGQSGHSQTQTHCSTHSGRHTHGVKEHGTCVDVYVILTHIVDDKSYTRPTQQHLTSNLKPSSLRSLRLRNECLMSCFWK